MTNSALSKSALLKSLDSANDAATLPVRQEALEQFLARGFPTTRDEDWKYTDLSRVAAISETTLATESPPSVAAADVDAIKSSIAASWIVIANGRINTDYSDAVDAVRIDTISGAVDTADPLADLNAALATTRIDISLTGQHDKPIGLLFIDSASSAAQSSHARIRISAAKESAGKFIEYHASSGTAEHYANNHISLNIAEDARVDYVRLQNRATSHFHTARLNVVLHERSVLQHFGADLGAALARNDLKIEIAGAGATAEFHGLYITDGKQHVDNHTLVDHRVGPAESMQEYRGVLAGRSRGVWNGKAVVHKGADGTDAKTGESQPVAVSALRNQRQAGAGNLR